METKLRGMVNDTFPLNENNNEELINRLSAIITENFFINEGPKWDKFKKGVKKGAKKVVTGAVIAATLGSGMLAGVGGAKKIDANRDYKSDMAINKSDSRRGYEDIINNWRAETNKIGSDEKTNYDTKHSLKNELHKNTDRVLVNHWNNAENKAKEIAERRDNRRTEGNKALAGAAGLAAVPLLAGTHALGVKKGKKEKEEQANKSLKERLNAVKLGMFLNEESSDITALRNKIRQGLILLPGLKGAEADRVEDSIRGWEDQINKLEKRQGIIKGERNE